MGNLLRANSSLQVLNSPRCHKPKLFQRVLIVPKTTFRAESASLKMKSHKDVAATLDGWALEGNFIDIIP